ncbi:MAG: WXG100 family type VII secretion target [Ardenticatenaceae bacterium]|nr:WXG100 family type VII secretion target [Anaerolineales bacterium]MCB8984529.1 WXG100 family type VII secretion target [Ardenticatenaceae bacterium]MCB8986172.1 WXG100 family type VII secretion target [Ardenticatenaceae bacterium]
MADLLEADYDILEQVSRRFSQQSDEIQQTLQNIRHRMDRLQNSWEGRGSKAFFAEMENEVVPAIHRLRHALDDAGTVTKKVAETLNQAEEEAGNSFQVV